MRHTPTVATIILAFLCAVPAGAQTGAVAASAPHDQVVSTNPFGFLFQWINGEYERKLSPETTVGVSGSYFADGGLGIVSALARWYPQRTALEGFYLGARAGAYRFRSYEYDYGIDPANPARSIYRGSRERMRVVPGAGIEVGYSWLLGAKRNVSVGIGGGLTRIAGGANGRGLPTVMPTIRLVNIGVAF